MNRKELIDAVALRGDMTKKQAEHAIDTVFGCVEDALEKNDNVKIVNFGTFSVKDHKQKKGRNPQTQEDIIIPAHKVPSFKPGKELKEKVDK